MLTLWEAYFWALNFYDLFKLTITLSNRSLLLLLIYRWGNFLKVTEMLKLSSSNTANTCQRLDTSWLCSFNHSAMFCFSVSWHCHKCSHTLNFYLQILKATTKQKMLFAFCYDDYNHVVSLAIGEAEYTAVYISKSPPWDTNRK